ncbi:MAG: hypothetical protein ACKVS7_15350 [Gemmatimonadaceae bacterium]
MTRQRPLRFVASLALLLAAGCGGDGPSGPGGDPSATGFSARVDGATYTPSLSAVASHFLAGAYSITAVRSSGANTSAMTISLINIPGPGTYPLGTGAGVAGGTATYVQNTAGWGTPLSGEAGTITITTLTDTRMVGTFSFTAEGVTGGATGTKAISNGTFDIAVNTSGSFGPVPLRNQNVVRATIGGQSYNASTIVTGSASGAIIFSTNSTKRSFAVSLTNLPGPGTYAVGSAYVSSVYVGAPVGAPPAGPLCCWANYITGSTGTVTVTSLTAGQISGTFSFSLQPTGTGAATAPLAITNGTFQIAW